MRVVQNITANAEVFATGDGATSVYPLTFDGLTLVEPEKARVTAIHRADWQGRQLLYPTPRTNLAKSSQNMRGTGWNVRTETVTNNNAGAPDGSSTLNKVVISTTAAAAHAQSQDFTGVPSGLCAMSNYVVPAGAPFTVVWLADQAATNTPQWSVILNSSGKITYNAGNLANGSATVTPGPNGSYKVSIQGSITAGTARCATAFSQSGTSVQYIYTGNGTDFYDAWGLMFGAGVGIAQLGAYIPTTSAPVTLTDYTLAPDGLITLGQVPVVGAVLDWDGSGTINPLDATPTFLSQYATSPILTSLIQAANETIDPQADFDAFMANVWDVYTAQGFGLDIWGRIVNIPRTINIPASNDFLGFDEALPDAEPFNQAPFYNGPQGGTLYTLTDDAYRVLILTKALANISSFTAQSMNALLNFMFNGQGLTRGSCYVLESGTPMQISYVFNFSLTSWEAAVLEQSSLMPRPAGVGVTITVNP